MSDAPFVLIDDNLSPDGHSLLFEDPLEIVVCDNPATWEARAARVERALGEGLFAAGFASYELGYATEPRLAGLMPETLSAPLLHFGLFRAPRRLDRLEARAWLESKRTGAHAVSNLRTDIDRDRYGRDFRKIMDYIAAGDVYQVNHTFGLRFELEGDPVSLYLELRRRQRVAYGGMARGVNFTLLSLSPELFFELKDQRIVTRPMKGTAQRAPTLADDRRVAQFLCEDEKSRAENLMIVDLLRNDFGRIAEVGSVRVPELFTVETYRTLHQMTSTVVAKLKPGVGLVDLLKGVFPCGSVTGAPKIRAMEIIRELEHGPRGAYTGAFGYFAPDGSARFNVAIRTMMLREGSGEMGIGSGLVADSDCEAEWRECLLKAEFLTETEEPFLLFETLLWERGKGYALLDFHLERLRESAAYFLYPYPTHDIEGALRDAEAGFRDEAYRVRLTLSEDGEVTVTAAPLAPTEPGRRWRFHVSDRRTRAEDVFLFHKTTRRGLYDGEYERWTRELGCDEVVFFNERDELTEGSRTNIFLDIGGRLYTPALRSGLLPGTLRRDLIEKGHAEERVLGRQDLERADRVLLGNSVRGLIEASPAIPAPQS